MVDEISDEVVVVLLKDKTGHTVLEACKRAHELITSRSKSTLKTWRFDRGTEFMNNEFDIWIHQELGAKQLFSNVEHPWENGRTERSFQTIFAKARSMLKHADLPNIIWGKAVLHAVFLKTRSPSTRTVVSPLQFRTGSPFNFNKLRVFGCPAQIFIRPSARTNPKLSDRSEKGIFVGMSVRGNGFIFLVRRTKTVLEVDSKDVLFNETFSDCRDRHGKIVPNGAVLQPDLNDASDFDSSYIQDGIAAHPRYAISSNSINPFAPMLITMNPRPKRMNPRLTRMILMIVMTPSMNLKMRHQQIYHMPPIRYLINRPSLRNFGIMSLFLLLIMCAEIDETMDRSPRSSSKFCPLNALFPDLRNRTRLQPLSYKLFWHKHPRLQVGNLMSYYCPAWNLVYPRICVCLPLNDLRIFITLLVVFFTMGQTPNLRRRSIGCLQYTLKDTTMLPSQSSLE